MPPGRGVLRLCLGQGPGSQSRARPVDYGLRRGPNGSTTEGGRPEARTHAPLREPVDMSSHAQSSEITCPKCGANQLTANKKGFGLGKAAAGGLLLGPVGLFGGLVGSGKVKITCLRCGHAWMAGSQTGDEPGMPHRLGPPAAPPPVFSPTRPTSSVADSPLLLDASLSNPIACRSEPEFPPGSPEAEELRRQFELEREERIAREERLVEEAHRAERRGRLGEVIIITLLAVCGGAILWAALAA